MKGKRKKKILKIALAVMGIAAIGLGYYAYTLTTVDQRFIRDMDRGLTASWALKNNEVQLQTLSEKNDTSFIETEYAAVEKYSNAKFHSKKLGKLAAEYIGALEQCRGVAESSDPNKDFNAFWKDFSEPYGQRLMAVYKIYKGDYGLLLNSEGSSAERDNLLAQGWLLNKAGEIEFKLVEKDGTTAYVAEIKNDSGFDLEFLDLEVALYDKKGKAIETVSAYAEDIQKGKTFELTFYQTGDKKIAQYMIVSEICKVKSKDSPAPEEEGAAAEDGAGGSEKDADGADKAAGGEEKEGAEETGADGGND